MGIIKMLKSDEEVKQFLKEAVERDDKRVTNVLEVMMWLSAQSVEVKVWNN